MKNVHQTSVNSDAILNLNIKVRLKISVFLTALIMIYSNLYSYLRVILWTASNNIINVISLIRETKRRKHIEQEFGQQNIPFSFFDAVYTRSYRGCSKEI